MLHDFLEANRTDLIERCRARVAARLGTAPLPGEAALGISRFLDQLIETLRLDARPDGARGRTLDLPPERLAAAARHGAELLGRGFSIGHVVHGYGDLCQAVAELAAETGIEIRAAEFGTLNRCLDEAIAEAVGEFDRRREGLAISTGQNEMKERLGSLAHEMRNFLNTATLAFAAIKSGRVAPQGATSAVVDRSLDGLRNLVDRALADVRLLAGDPARVEDVQVERFVAEVQLAAGLEARARHCEFAVAPVSPGLTMRADRQMLFSAVSNLLQNAFKYTRARTHVRLAAYGAADRVLIEVEDRCGGLAPGAAERMFRPFDKEGADRTGLGLGLSIARRAVEGSGGTLGVRDLPGVGCVFAIDLPRAC